MSSFYIQFFINPLTPQNGQRHSNNSSAVVSELFESVWPFCGVCAYRANFQVLIHQSTSTYEMLLLKNDEPYEAYNRMAGVEMIFVKTDPKP